MTQTAAGRSRPEAGAPRPPEVERALQRSREQFEQLNARFPGTKEKLIAGFQLDLALRFAEFFAQAGIVGEQRDRLIELLADEMFAPNRGELGEREVAEMRRLIGDDKFEQLRAYAKLSPGLQRADEIMARLRDARVDLGESEAGLRDIAASTATATEEIRRRVYRGTPLGPEEEGQLVLRARARFEPLRRALGAAGDERALGVIDAWIAQKITADLQFTREVLARHAKRSSP